MEKRRSARLRYALCVVICAALAAATPGPVGGAARPDPPPTTLSAADAYEPDDTYAQANTIAANSTQEDHNFHAGGDEDWIQFSAAAGAMYTIETVRLGSNCDTVLEVYDTDGSSLLAYNDDGSTPPASRLEWTAPTSDIYYIRVYERNNSYGNDANYDVWLRGADVYEPDNSPTQASTIAANSTQEDHNTHVAGDEDWIRFTAVTDVPYTIETLNLGSSADTYLYLYGTDGTTLLESDDDGGIPPASRIKWTASATGTYYVRVRHFSSFVYGVDTAYDLRLTCTCDAYEPDDAPSQASTIIAAIPQQDHNFHRAGDEDWIAFTAAAGAEYTIETLNLGSRADTTLYLYGPDGTTLLGFDDDSGTGRASRIVWVAPNSDTYYVRVRQANSGTYGSDTEYDVLLSGPDAYESDDSYLEASTIAVDETQDGHTFHDAGDEDWIAFTAVVDAEYTIETLNLGSSANTYMSLYDINGGSILAEDDDGGDGLASRIVWAAPTTGTYYILVRNVDGGIYGQDTAYDLRLEATCDVYEPDDTYLQASDLVLGIAQEAHNVHTAGDQDWARFSAMAGAKYTIETLNLGDNADTVLYLYDRNGTTILAQNDDFVSGSRYSRIEAWEAPATGTYYARVRHFDGAAYGGGSEYDLGASGSERVFCALVARNRTNP